MYRVTFLLVALCVGYSSAEKPVVHLIPEKVVEVMPQVIQCVAETGVDFELLEKLRTASPGDTKDPKLPKFIFCAFRKNGLATKTGHPDIEKMLTFHPDTADKAAIRKVMVECDKDGKNPEDTMFQYMKCLQKKSPVRVTF